jgi:alanyl-tRNA synthetase
MKKGAVSEGCAIVCQALKCVKKRKAKSWNMGHSTVEIRRRFLEYFRNHGHQEVSSSPVVPHDDPTLLFTNAGMNQFKDVFLGKTKRDYTRATTSQKCIRAGGKHNDLENVGHTTRHLTFFEMLGNFSFGDYFKKDAIKFAWEVSTQVFRFPEDRIYPTVFRDDDEAFDLWTAYVPSSRITRFGEKENFWAMGDTGPCGPCSELLFDRGPEYGSAASPSEDTSGERYLEFWNLVFMQFNRSTDGKMDPLPRPSIDTGAGLERVVSLIQKKDTVYETDILRSLISGVERISGKKYDPSTPIAPAFRVIADHLRSLSFAIADGAQPSNTDRGYVLRKILRRAVRYGKQLGFESPFLGKLLPDLIHVMGDPYIELQRAESRIEEILTLEEEAFFRTLRRGGNILSKVIEQSEEGARCISGDDAFLLKDTYGLPLEEIQLIAIDHNLSIDASRFDELEMEAKERSKAARKACGQVAEKSAFEEIVRARGATEFVRTGVEGIEAKVVACMKDCQLVDHVEAGDEVVLILDKTPFYAEMGGQVGDQGSLQNSHCYINITDTQTPFAGLTAHIGTVQEGSLRVHDTVHASVNRERRAKIEANHTATHLLHTALNEVLGEHTRQSGSLVNDEYLRFDFAHHKAVTAEELTAVENRVNELIREDHEARCFELTLEEAQKRPDIKQFFGEKYGAVVRVLEVGPSRELCGGSHVFRTGKIGYFRILKESSIAAGIRRIEAVTGQKAIDEARNADKELDALSELLKVPAAKLSERLSRLLSDTKAFEAELKQLKREKLQLLLSTIQPKAVGENRHVIAGVLPIQAEELKIAAEEASKENPTAIIVVGCQQEDRAHLFIKVPPALAKAGLHAGNILKQVLPMIEGNGGGKAESAQGAGKQTARLRDAIESIVALCKM